MDQAKAQISVWFDKPREIRGKLAGPYWNITKDSKSLLRYVTAAMVNNLKLTGNDLMVHTAAVSSGTYRTWPTVVLNLGESASLGTGIMISTLFAVDLRLNWLFAWKKLDCT